MSIDMNGTVTTRFETGTALTGIGWLPGGDMLVVASAERRLLRVDASGAARVHADLSHVGASAHPLNDLWVDPEGRAYVGEFGVDVHAWLAGIIPAVMEGGLGVLPTLPMDEGALLRVDSDGSIHEAVPHLRFANGMAPSRDGRQLVVAETFGARLSAFALDASGALGGREVWDLGFGPDGVSEVDEEGCFWVANPTGRTAERIEPGGRSVDSVSSEQSIYACALGGDDGRTLFLCTSSSAEPQQTESLRDGRIEVATVTVPVAGTAKNREEPRGE